MENSLGIIFAYRQDGVRGVYHAEKAAENFRNVHLRCMINGRQTGILPFMRFSDSLAMTGDELRQRFLDFFGQRGHTVVPSSSLLPDDPSVLLTTAGMQQFKSYYTGELDPETTRHPNLGGPVGRNATSVQKSFRTSDIDRVGDESHLTFFEMLGNFSFGGYFKEESIKLGYEFITKELGLIIDYVTVFGGDDSVPADIESERIWEAIDPSIDVRRAGREDNFWGPTGSDGPCGPTTEIYVNGLEIWNHVFNEFYCDKNGGLEKLKTPGVDTGMGFERLLQVVQGTNNVFEVDLLSPLMNYFLRELTGGESRDITFDSLLRPDQDFLSTLESLKGKSKALTNARIVSDHIRGAAFLLADGVRPSNKDAGYILRRLMRRALLKLYQHNLGYQQGANGLDWINNYLVLVIKLYGNFYPELLDNQNDMLTAFENETKKYYAVLEDSLKQFNRLVVKDADKDSNIEAQNVDNINILPGDIAFDLYQSYGVPIELTEEIASEKGMEVDLEGFQKAQKEHRETSKKGSEAKFGGHGLLLNTGEIKAGDEGGVKRATRLHTATHLLHAALRTVLGDHVEQQGSDITPERLRFDFTHPQALTAEEKSKVEELVNNAIADDLPVTREEMPFEQAKKEGALAFFREKYPETVLVYTVGDKDDFFSKECCGGPHVTHTGEIGGIEITKEQSSSAGVRRIRAKLRG